MDIVNNRQQPSRPRSNAAMAQLSPLLKQATPVLVDRGEGVYLYDVEGNRHLDFTAGIGVTSTGHCHPRVVEAARAQVGKLIHGQYTTVMHKPLLELTERLGNVLPSGLDSLFFANSGSEAVEAALRLARQATRRPNVIVFQGGFHGRTVAAASMTTSGTRFSAGFSPLMGGVHVAPFPYAFHYGWDEQTATKFALRELDYLFATVSAPNETAAFFIEPVLGEGGYVPANTEFMAGLRERADAHGILLVLDEIQTGFGRTGKFWGHDHFGVRPDVVLIAKGLASGFPLSGIAASGELMTKGWPGSQGGTYGGNAVSCAAAVATLDVIGDEGLVENAAVRGRQLLDGARLVGDKTPAIGDVRGLGLLVGSEFTKPDGEADTATAQAAQKAAAERGLLLLTCGAYMNVVRMIPPLIVDSQQVDEALRIWADVVTSVTGS
jgi:4-aminobutyrate aminotransferase